MALTGKRFAVIQHWKDNPNDFAVVEFFETIKQCKAYIAKQKKCSGFKWGIGEYQ